MRSHGTIAPVISGNRYVSCRRLTSQQRRRAFVEPINVRARLYLSRLVNEYCLIGEVNWNGVLQIDIPLAPAVGASECAERYNPSSG